MSWHETMASPLLLRETTNLFSFLVNNFFFFYFIIQGIVSGFALYLLLYIS